MCCIFQIRRSRDLIRTDPPRLASFLPLLPPIQPISELLGHENSHEKRKAKRKWRKKNKTNTNLKYMLSLSSFLPALCHLAYVLAGCTVAVAVVTAHAIRNANPAWPPPEPYPGTTTMGRSPAACCSSSTRCATQASQTGICFPRFISIRFRPAQFPEAGRGFCARFNGDVPSIWLTDPDCGAAARKQWEECFVRASFYLLTQCHPEKKRFLASPCMRRSPECLPRWKRDKKRATNIAWRGDEIWELWFQFSWQCYANFMTMPLSSALRCAEEGVARAVDGATFAMRFDGRCFIPVPPGFTDPFRVTQSSGIQNTFNVFFSYFPKRTVFLFSFLWCVTHVGCSCIWRKSEEWYKRRFALCPCWRLSVERQCDHVSRPCSSTLRYQRRPFLNVATTTSKECSKVEVWKTI